MNVVLSTFLLSFIMILLVIAGMAIGVMNGRRAISGSCGGLSGGGCELCSGDCKKKREAMRNIPDGESA
jgi:hypothetical protein